jgi:hypothetical protein
MLGARMAVRTLYLSSPRPILKLPLFWTGPEWGMLDDANLTGGTMADMGTAGPRRPARKVVFRRLGVIPVLSALMSMAGFGLLVSPALSKPEYLAEFNKRYSAQGTKLDSCSTCHTTSQDADHLNPYGADFRKANHDLGAIEGLDSDGDTFKNADEIQAGTFPGDPNDNPNTKAKPKPAPTTTTTKPFPFSLLPNGLPVAGDASQLLSILDGRQ